MKALIGIRKHLCVILVVQPQTQERHRDAKSLYYKRQTFTIDSRRLIERWKKEGKSNREIASLLGKAPQTIHTQIKRGTVLQCLKKGRL